MTCRTGIDQRKRLYTMLQVGRTELGMDEDTYRAFLGSHGAVEKQGRVSATTMSLEKLWAAVAALKRLGFRPRSTRPAAARWRQPRIEKITALWCALADAGVVHDRREVAMTRWCAKLTGTADLKWSTTTGLNNCIEALKAWAQRERVPLRKPRPAPQGGNDCA